MLSWWYGANAAAQPPKLAGENEKMNGGWTEMVDSDLALLSPGTVIQQAVPRQFAPARSEIKPLSVSSSTISSIASGTGTAVSSAAVPTFSPIADQRYAEPSHSQASLNTEVSHHVPPPHEENRQEAQTLPIQEERIIHLSLRPESLKLRENNLLAPVSPVESHPSLPVHSEVASVEQKDNGILQKQPSQDVVVTSVTIITLIVSLLLAVVWNKSGGLISFGSTAVSLAFAMVGLVFAPVVLFPRIGPNTSLVLTFAITYVLAYLEFSFFWIGLFGASVFTSLLLVKRSEAFHPRQPKVEHAGRDWFNLLAQTVIQYATKLKVPQFDIGGVPPRIAESEFLTAPNGKGFEMSLFYEYPADENTKIEIEVPLVVPVVGEVKVPVFVSSPRLAGKVHLDCRIDECSLPAKGKSTYMAVAVCFEPIEEVHIGDIRISVASKFQYLQWFSMVKSQMKAAVNSLLSSERLMIFVFDQAFTMLGTVYKDVPKTIQKRSAESLRPTWNLTEVLHQLNAQQHS